MQRRSLLTAGAALIAGCQRSADPPPARAAERPPVTVPAFSQPRLHERLEQLREAYEGKGLHVTPTLRPSIAEDELRRRCDWFPAPLPEELVALYGWHEGQEEEPWKAKFPFWFRECAFARLDFAKAEYQSMMSTYGADPSTRPLLEHCFPFAFFNGGWLVLPARDQSLDDRFKRPVISVFQGISIHYYSLQLMVDTCVDWVSHPQYRPDSSLPSRDEMDIWRRHNPGIFEA